MKFYSVEVRKARKGEDCLFTRGVRVPRAVDDTDSVSNVILREFDRDPFAQSESFEVHTHAEIAELSRRLDAMERRCELERSEADDAAFRGLWQRVEALENAAKAEPTVHAFKPGDFVEWGTTNVYRGMYRCQRDDGRHDVLGSNFVDWVVCDADIRPVKVVEAAD